MYAIIVVLALGLAALILFLSLDQTREQESYVSRKSVRNIVIGILVSLLLALAVFYPGLKARVLDFQKKFKS